jgi:hypothetical protein
MVPISHTQNRPNLQQERKLLKMYLYSITMNLNSKLSRVSGSKILRSTANKVAYTVPSLRSRCKYSIHVMS